MGKSTDKNKWTMTYTPGTKYKLTCKDNNFSEQEMSVMVRCGGQVMTDNLYVTVKAKQGDIAVSGNNISATLSLTYSTNEVSISEGKTTIKASVAEKGWVEAEETGEKTKKVTASGSYIIPLSSTKYAIASSSGYYLSPDYNTYFKDSNVYVPSVKNYIPVVTESERIKNEDSESTHYQLNYNQIFVVSDVNENGSTTASKPWIRWSTTSSGWDVNTNSDNVYRGSVIYCKERTYDQVSSYTYQWRYHWYLYNTNGNTTRELGATSADYCYVNVYQDNHTQYTALITIGMTYIPE